MRRHDTFNMITHLEGDLKAVVELSPHEYHNAWLLDIRLIYQDEPAGRTSFNLEGYSSSEAEAIARNIKNNEFLMKEIDEYLWGESD